MCCNKVKIHLHRVSKNVPPSTYNNNNPICKAPECQKTSVALDNIIFTYTIRLRYYCWQKCYWQSKKSDDVLFSHLIYLVLLHYLAK